MACPFLRVEKNVSRRTGQSAVAAAAYRAGACLWDAEIGAHHDYTGKQVLASGVALPPGVDDAWTDREQLWNEAHAKDRRSNSTLARNVVVALPHELDAEAQERLAIEYCQWLAERHGVAADWAIHPADDHGDQRNTHLHVLMTTRRISDTGLGAKTRELDVKATSREHIEAWRSQWAAMATAELQRAGHAARLDLRSYKRQGIQRQGGAHLGPHASALERQGLTTAAGRQNRRAAFRNRQAAAAKDYSARIAATGRPITRATLAKTCAAAGLVLRRQERQGRRWLEIIDPAQPKATAVPVGRIPGVGEALKQEQQAQAEARRQQQAQAQQRQQAAATAQKAGRAAKRLMQQSESAADEARAGFAAGQAAAEAAAAITAALGRWGQQRAAQQVAQAVQQAATDRRPKVGERTASGTVRLGLGQPKREWQPQAMDPGAIAARQKQREQKGR